MTRFNLQMFADEAVAEEAKETTETTEETATEEIIEEVTPEEEKKPEKKTYTDEDVNRIVKQKLAAERKKQEKERKEQDEAKKLKEMNEQQKAEYQIKELQDKLAVMERKEAKSEMLKTARSILADKDITVGDELVMMLISEDADATNDAVNEFADAFKAEVEKTVKDALKGSTPKKGGPSGGITKEQIMAVKNRAERQKLIDEHKELFQ